MKRETPLGLYKGLGAVLTGIIPKMAIRFTSYEWYKQLLADKKTGSVTGKAIFLGESGYTAFYRASADLTPSWPGSRRHRSCCGCDSNGGRKDKVTGTAPFNGGSLGRAKVSKCGACALHGP